MTPEEIAIQQMIAEGGRDMPMPYWPEDTDPEGEMIEVTSVNGRYPSQPRIFRPQTVEVTVCEIEPGKIVLRVDDSANPVFWLEIRLSLNRTES